MTDFEETLLPLARAVLPDDQAAGDFVSYLEAEWSHAIRQAENERREKALIQRLPQKIREAIEQAQPPQKKRLTVKDIPPCYLDSAAVLLRVRQERINDASLVTWKDLTRSERSRAWKEIPRHLLGEEGSWVDAARRRQVIRSIQLAALALGGELLTYSDSGGENAGNTTGVKLVRAALGCLGLPVVGDRVLAEDIKAIRLWAMKVKRRLQNTSDRRKFFSVVEIIGTGGFWAINKDLESL